MFSIADLVRYTNILLVLVLFQITSCKHSQIKPGEIFSFDGFAIQSPESPGWMVIKRDVNEISFAKPTKEGMSHTIRAFVKVKRDRIFLNKKDLVSFVESFNNQANDQSGRFKITNSKTSKKTLGGVECVASNYTMEDHNVPNAKGKVLMIAGNDNFCPHPSYPESYIIRISYSERFLLSRPKLLNESYQRYFLNNIRFNDLGQDPLIKSVKKGDMISLKSLIADGADVNIHGPTYDWKKTALHEASLRGNVEIMKVLIDSGANVNAKDEYGDTALMFASAFPYNEAVDLLLKNGADVDAEKPNGNTALMIASRAGRLGIVEAILAAAADVNSGLGSGDTALSLAARNGHLNIMRILINYGADVNQQFDDGRSLLFVYTYQNPAVAKLLITSGANVNSKSKVWMSPLMSASLDGNSDLVRMFIAYGAEVNYKFNKKNDYTGNSTALHWAAIYGHQQIVIILLEQGADIDSKTLGGFTALMNASMNGHAEVIKALIANGADPKIINKVGKTALDLAREGSHSEVIKILEKSTVD